MLIIGQPKAASTSLKTTLEKITGIAAEQRRWKCNKKILKEFLTLSKFHHDMGEFKKETLEAYAISRKRFFKQHILPTENNLKILKEIDAPVVVLLRDPKAAQGSYQRAVNKRIWRNTDKEAFQQDINLFYKRYKGLKKNPKFLIITFDDLVLNTKKTIHKVLKHFKIKFDPTQNIKLTKEKYTGVGLRQLRKK